MADGPPPHVPGPGMSPDQVARQAFPTSFRGFDPAEVRAFLQRVAAELDAAAARERDLQARLSEAQATPPPPAQLDEEALVAALGEESGRVLRTAREAAADVRSKAEENAQRLLQEARDEAEAMTSAAESVLAERTAEAEAAAGALMADAETQAEAIRAAAREESEAILDAARAQGRDMVDDAHAVRERVLADLARRKRTLQQQIETMRGGRDHLVDRLREARVSLDELAERLARPDPESVTSVPSSGGAVGAAGALGAMGGAVGDVADPGAMLRPGGPPPGHVDGDAPTDPNLVAIDVDREPDGDLRGADDDAVRDEPAVVTAAAEQSPAAPDLPPVTEPPEPPADERVTSALRILRRPRDDHGNGTGGTGNGNGLNGSAASVADGPEAPSRPELAVIDPSSEIEGVRIIGPTGRTRPAPEPAGFPAQPPSPRDRVTEPEPEPAPVRDDDAATSETQVEGRVGVGAVVGVEADLTPESDVRSTVAEAAVARGVDVPVRPEPPAPSATVAAVIDAPVVAPTPEVATSESDVAGPPEPTVTDTGQRDGADVALGPDVDETAAPADEPTGVDDPADAGTPEPAAVQPEPEPEPERDRESMHAEPANESEPGAAPDATPADAPAPAAATPAMAEEKPARAAVDELFARIRADRAAKVAEAHEVLQTSAPTAPTAAAAATATAVAPVAETTPEPEPEAEPDPDIEPSAPATVAPVVAAEAPSVEVDLRDAPIPVPAEVAVVVTPDVDPHLPPAEVDEALLQRRDAALEPAETQLVRRVKRALQDEQNDVLDRLRTTRGVPSPADVLVASTEHGNRYVAAALPLLADAARAAGGAADVAPVDDLAAQLAADLTESLQDRLQRTLLDAATAEADATAVADRISGVYREWKTQRVDRIVRYYAVAAYARGAFLSAPADATFRWIVDDDAACPDCDDNALAGAVAKGEPFPTGQLHPPAHLGCRCILAATPD